MYYYWAVYTLNLLPDYDKNHVINFSEKVNDKNGKIYFGLSNIQVRS